MARRRRGVFGWIVVLSVVGLAVFGGYTLSQTDAGQTTIEAAEAAGSAAAKVVKDK